MPDKKDVAKRFFLFHANLTTSEIAKRYGVLPEAVLNWEKRVAPPWKTLKYFCDSEGISWDWLLDGVGSMYHPAKRKRSPESRSRFFRHI
ncbi:MAG: helix-turn-helix domain-containing protein [Planctomycetaceae bacterium]|nr:helix-turn-helix domain-containing protein [Planctomycetaceae bacterium]